MPFLMKQFPSTLADTKTWSFNSDMSIFTKKTQGHHPQICQMFVQGLPKTLFDLQLYKTQIPKPNVANISLLLMEEILHQSIWEISHYLYGFIHPRWCRICSINSITKVMFVFFVLNGHHPFEDTRRPIRSSILSQVSFDISVKYPIISMDGRLTHIWLIFCGKCR